jgi:hypothetical protein
MKQIQDLIDQGIITNFTVGKSGLKEKGLFCSMRFNALEGYVQGSGQTVEEAFADTLRRLPPMTLTATRDIKDPSSRFEIPFVGLTMPTMPMPLKMPVVPT